ncbi:MAG: glutathione S-transferase [Beijerinckiaceae bacterium]|nr:glutathione S-transferase [Beijerinckiaceae bacterium]
MQIWGRRNSVNVQKVLWCLDELSLTYERIDAGMHHGRNDTPDYLALNPNGRIPLLVDGDFSLWESNSILRYLALAKHGEAIYPAAARVRASVDRWLDWSLSTLQPAEHPVFWGLVRTPPEKRDMALLQEKTNAVARLWRLIDAHLDGRAFLEGETFTLADITIGSYARRWFGVEGVDKPSFPQIERWYRTLAERPGFVAHVAPPLT